MGIPPEPLAARARLMGWYGVDLDGTLAVYPGSTEVAPTIGPPTPLIDAVQRLLLQGFEVRIFTARAGDDRFTADIEAWSKHYLGRVLPITNVKDYGMIQLWDDRARQIIENTGVMVHAPS